MPLIIGIDPSLSSTGIASYGVASPGDYRVEIIKSKPAAGLYPRMARFDEMADAVVQEIRHCRLKCLNSSSTRVLIEGYSYGSNGMRTLDIAEFGGILRSKIIASLWGDRAELIEVPPSTLKKFLTNKGNADKKLMRKCLGIITGRLFTNDDAVDAVGLCLLCRVMEDPSIAKFPYMADVAEDFRARIA